MTILFVLVLSCPRTFAAPATNESPGRLTEARNQKFDEYFPPPHETQLKTRIECARAVPTGQGDLFQITQVKVQTWLMNGQPELIIETPQCSYSQRSKLIYSPGPLGFRTADGRFSIEGDGFTLFQTNSLLFISNHVHTIVHPSVPQVSSNKAAEAQPLSEQKEIEVFSDRFQFSKQTDIGLYEGNVRVSGTNLAMTCGTAEVRVPEELRALESINASHNVVMDYGLSERGIRNIHVEGDNALYLATNGITTVTGRPTWRADQKEGSGDQLTLDATNKIFRATGHAFVRMPEQSLGQTTFLPQQPASGPGRATNAFVEVRSDHYLFETNFASFGDQVEVIRTADKATNGTMTCATMLLYFAETNQVQTMLAERNVVIAQATNQFKADRALYTGTNELLNLTGNPSWRSGDREGKGDLIQVSMSEEQMIVSTNAFMRLPANQLGESFSVQAGVGASERQSVGATTLSRSHAPTLSPSHPPTPSSPTASPPNIPSPQRSNTPIPPEFADIICEQYSIRTNSALFTGAVRVVHPRLKLSCDAMSADLTDPAAKNSRLVAQGGVDFDLTDEDHRVHGSGDKVVYTYEVVSGVTNSTAVLTGNSVVQAEEGTITNSMIILDRLNHKITAPGKFRLYGLARNTGTNVLESFKNAARPPKR